MCLTSQAECQSGVFDINLQLAITSIQRPSEFRTVNDQPVSAIAEGDVAGEAASQQFNHVIAVAKQNVADNARRRCILRQTLRLGNRQAGSSSACIDGYQLWRLPFGKLRR